MGPKKNPTAEEVEDIKKSLDFITKEVSAMGLQPKSILDLIEEVKALRLRKISTSPTKQKQSHIPGAVYAGQ